MRVYHFVNEKYGLEDLTKRRLKIASIDDLNDPYEIMGFSSRNSKIRAALSFSKQHFATRFGMLCFSRKWSNPVLWSHYADKHKGICLGFDISRRLLTPVRYQSERLWVTSDTFSAYTAMQDLDRLVSTKFEHWRYEDEIRMIIPLVAVTKEKGLYFEYFSRGMRLREVILGHCSSLTKRDLKRAVRDKQVSLIKARLAFQSFKVVKQNDESLWT